MADYKEAFEQEFAKQQKELGKANLAVVGGSGVGKSSIINRIFGKDIAQTGNGQPITRRIKDQISSIFFKMKETNIIDIFSADKTKENT